MDPQTKKPDYSNFNARANGQYEKIWQSTGKCVFCDLKDKYIVHEINGVVLTMNLFPYAVGHMLIIPRRHFEMFEEVTKEEWATMQELSKIAIDVLKKTIKTDKLWLLFRAPAGYGAGKSVNHAHMHVIPYELGLMEFKYKDITQDPIDTASLFRQTLDEINKSSRN